MNGFYICTTVWLHVISECLIVEFEIRGDDCPLADATRAVDVSVDAQPPQLRSDGNTLLRFSAPENDDCLTHSLDSDDRIRYLHRVHEDQRASHRCLSKHPCVVHELVNEGLLIESLGYQRGRATVTGAVVGYDVLEGVMDRAGETVGVTLQRVYPLGPDEDQRESVTQRFALTPKQTEALRVGTEMGYFELPREADAETVAAELGVSKSAFLERLRRAERSVFSRLLR